MLWPWEEHTAVVTAPHRYAPQGIHFNSLLNLTFGDVCLCNKHAPNGPAKLWVAGCGEWAYSPSRVSKVVTPTVTPSLSLRGARL